MTTTKERSASGGSKSSSSTSGWSSELDGRAVDLVRALAMDSVEAAGSGHPGTAMSLAPTAYLLFQEFLRHDPTAWLYYADSALDRYLDFALAAVDRDEPDRVIARAFSVPFVFRDGSAERAELPAGGWDAVIAWADRDWRAGRRPNAVSALEIMVLPPYRGRGLSRAMLG